jgi:hypothetical protein
MDLLPLTLQGKEEESLLTPSAPPLAFGGSGGKHATGSQKPEALGLALLHLAFSTILIRQCPLAARSKMIMIGLRARERTWWSAEAGIKYR